MTNFYIFLAFGAIALSALLAYLLGGFLIKGEENKTMRSFARAALFFVFGAICKNVVYPQIIEMQQNDVDMRLQKISVYRAIKEKEPQLYERLVKEMKTAKADNLSDVEMMLVARGKLQPVLISRLSTASDDALLDYFKTQNRMLKALGKHSGEACMSMVNPEQNARQFRSSLSLLDESLMDEVLDASEQVILQQTNPQAPLSITVEPVLIDVYETLSDKYGKAVIVLEDPNTSKYSAKKKCKIYRDFSAQVFKKDKQTAASVFRYLVNSMQGQ